MVFKVRKIHGTMLNGTVKKKNCDGLHLHVHDLASIK